MALTRRRLLGAAAGTAVLAGCGGARRPAPAAAEGADAAAARLEPRSWASVRRQFVLDRRTRDFNAYYLAPHPAPVRAAIERHRRGLDRGAHAYLDANQSVLEEATARAAGRHLGVPARQIAFTDSTTMGLGLVYGGLALREGDEVLTTEHDHWIHHEAIRLAVERAGAAQARVALYDVEDPVKADADAMVQALTAAITPRTTVVGLTWVHSGTGVKLPLARLAAAVKATAPGALVVVDGVHGFGAEAARPGALGCDVFVSGCHKWLMGPRGTGLVWATPAAWQRVTPVIPTFASGQAPGALHTPGGFHTFEHRWALAQAFRFQRAIGPARIQARVRTLAARLRRGLAGLGGVRVITPPGALMAGLVMVDLANAPAEQVVAELRSAGIATSVPPYQQRYVRFGTQVTLSPADVDAAVRAVRRLA